MIEWKSQIWPANPRVFLLGHHQDAAAIRSQVIDQKAGTKTGRLAKELLDLKDSASRAGAAGLAAVNRLLERAEAEAAINIRT